MNETATSTTLGATARKPPSIHSAAKARVYKWSRRIMITTESLWLKKIRRNKFKAFLCVFFPSAFIFLLAFTLAPPRGYSNSNNLMFYMGGVVKPDIMFTSGVIPKRIHSARDCGFFFFLFLLGFVGVPGLLMHCGSSPAFDVRYTPLFAALGYGATSIEIYVWLKDGVLHVRPHRFLFVGFWGLMVGMIF